MSVDNNLGIRDILTPNSYLGKGMAWPPREDPKTGDFERAEAEVSVSDGIQHLFATTLGEISPLTTFGSRLDELLFDGSDEPFIAEILQSLRRSLESLDNRITVIDLSYVLGAATTSSRTLTISMRYRIVASGKVETFVQRLPPAGAS